jgi:cytochrome c553
MYMNLHRTCEACGIVEAREYHHIITRATGGKSVFENALALCAVCHRTWHDIGRKSFCFRYPHLEPKVIEACKIYGRKF